jgi:phosphohistidine phosphatase
VKVLYLLRHAKSSWEDPEVPDQDRPLAPRGKRALRAIAEQFTQHRIEPSLVLCSPARRARETLQPLRRVFSEKVEVLFEPALYAATSPELLNRLRSVPDRHPSVMLVGHNPGLQELGVLLARPSAKRDVLAAKFPTGALASLDLDVDSWPDLGKGPGELTSLILPRDVR